MITAITNARVFDGERINEQTVTIDVSAIIAAGGAMPNTANTIDVYGAAGIN